MILKNDRKQINEATWLKQLEHWSTLILNFAAHKRLFELEINAETLSLSIFNNQTIKRHLSEETLGFILDEMVLQGQAEWIHSKQQPKKAALYWKKPSEWAEMIYNHIQITGQTGMIVTIQELFYSDEASAVEFYQLPESLWRKSIGILQKSGKAQIFDSGRVESNLDLGVKFI